MTIIKYLESEWLDFVDQAKYEKNSARWITALESDKYAQTDGLLHYRVRTGEHWRVGAGKKNAYCCLGLGCKLARIPSAFAPQGVLYGASQNVSMPPAEFARWLGFDPTTGVHRGMPGPSTSISVHLNNARSVKNATYYIEPEDSGQTVVKCDIEAYADLAAMNDNGTPFSEIARLIAKYDIRMRWV